jgi:hypothetical protein
MYSANTGVNCIVHLGELRATSRKFILAKSVTYSIVAHPPTVSVEQHGAFSNTLKPGITSDITLFHPLDAHNRQDTTASHAGSDIALISSNGTQIPNSIPNTGVTLQTSTGVHRAVSDPQLTPFTTLPPPSSVIPTEPPPSVESALVQPDHLSHPQGFPSSTLTTVNPQITPQDASVFVTRSIDDLGSREHDETRDPNPSIPTKALLHVEQSGPSTPQASGLM